jgi:hypothetical protein
MTPWEYRLVEVFVHGDLGERQLTSYGSDGWEAVGMHVQRDQPVMLILMKRPAVQAIGAEMSANRSV